MLTPNQRITESIIETLDRLLTRNDLPSDVLFDLNIAAISVRHLQHIDQFDGKDVCEYGRELHAMLQSMKEGGILVAERNNEINAAIELIIVAAERLVASSLTGNALKQSFIALQRLVDQKFSEIYTIAPGIATALFSDVVLDLLRQYGSIDMLGQQSPGSQPAANTYATLTETNLTTYFQQKLCDSTATVSKMVTLPGGFGKETSLFTLSSKTLNSDLVMRRDAPVDSWEGLDCHIASHEFPLLKAVHARGFPAPEPMFFEKKSDIIKGPAFTIMRRAAGSVAGDATGGQGRISAELQQTLAQVAARLHSVPPLVELADIPAFDVSLWEMTASECTRRYIESWFSRYLTAAHQPIPALHGMFHWLLSHFPTTDDASTLVHGDIGFHNLLFNNGQLSAVLDWEFGHIGDPAEDLGYIRSMMGTQLDWDQFIVDYGSAGRPVPTEQRVRFYEIWSHVRNTAASAMATGDFEEGRLRNIRSNIITLRFVPHFVARAEALIADYNNSFCSSQRFISI